MRLKGQAIPLESRIIRVVDEYDDLTAARPGKQSLTIQEALSRINSMKGALYDPKVVDVFTRIIKATYSSVPGDDQGMGTIKQVLDRIITKFKKGEVQLPVLPTIVQKVKQAIDSQYSSADDIAKILELDAVISIRIISVANSIAFRGREKILTVRQAVPRLGTARPRASCVAIVNRTSTRPRRGIPHTHGAALEACPGLRLLMQEDSRDARVP